MCGIAGFAGFDDNALLGKMAACLVHRGPDAGGVHTDRGVGLASRRLAVIDLKTGNQPIANEDRSVWVVFNGEIYNCDALRAELMARGHRLSTTSDTECIVHLYEDHGLGFVGHLRGMFAIALWDATRRRLVLARDRIGEKPLYYAIDGERLLFGSECKAVLQARRARAVDPQAVCEYLALGYVPAPRTFYDGIAKLPPAHLLVHEDGRATVRRYWSRTGRQGPPPAFVEAEHALAGRLDETIGLCLKSDVEVGAFLSGGIDSSVTVALMRRHDRRVQTFAVGYDGAAAGFNELAYARRVARDLGTEHHELDSRSWRPPRSAALDSLALRRAKWRADLGARVPVVPVHEPAREGRDVRHRRRRDLRRLSAVPGGPAARALPDAACRSAPAGRGTHCLQVAGVHDRVALRAAGEALRERRRAHARRGLHWLGEPAPARCTGRYPEPRDQERRGGSRGRPDADRVPVGRVEPAAARPGDRARRGRLPARVPARRTWTA